VSLQFTRKTGEKRSDVWGRSLSGDIAEGLAAQGFKIDKRQAQLGEPLKKRLANFPVTIKVFRDVHGANQSDGRKRSVGGSSARGFFNRGRPATEDAP